jgi:ABC-type amino acid transport substrate-binding protein
VGAAAALLGGAGLPVAAATDLPAGTLAACVFELPVSAGERVGVTQLEDKLLSLLAADLNLPLRRVAVPFERQSQAMAAGECDVALGNGPGPDRVAGVRASRTLLTTPLRAVVPIGPRRAQSWADLDRPGRRLGVARGGVAAIALQGRLQHATLVVFQVEGSSLDDLESGRIDALVMTQLYAEGVAQTSGTVRLVDTPAALPAWSFAFVSAADRPTWGRRLDDFARQLHRDGRLRRAADAAGLGGLVAP